MYRRAFLRTYAASVALDPRTAIERYDRVFSAAAPRAAEALPEAESRPAPAVRRRTAPLRPVLMSAFASVPAMALPSVRAFASFRLPHPGLQARHVAVAAL